uniref:CCDC43 PWI-like domain-containing protein n=1 Tax=Grammatophora oceanica TaxID=210454 RepID=A0A7S1VMV5_9STRA|mmetsp:Transcript_50961/g.76210  ORF Transcript_50961/g.76210 Transcript_50961/m.76210 type:complete len:234 (+) Transcript_50961:43-744(+)
MAENDEEFSAYLEKKLTELGLDFETYGSYVMGLVDGEEEEGEEEEQEEVWELLRASSETHSDDDKVWEQFQKEVKEYVVKRKAKEEAAQQHAKEEAFEKQKQQLAQDIELAKKQQEAAAEAADGTADGTSEPVDAAKQALLNRFAYDESDTYDKDGKLVDKNNKKGGDSADGGAMSNREVAQKAHQEQAQQMKSKGGTVSKQTARDATKQAKAQKAALKDARRQRAQKGERKR